MYAHLRLINYVQYQGCNEEYISLLHWSRLSFRAIVNRLFDRILIDEINKDNCIEFDRIDEAFYREKQI